MQNLVKINYINHIDHINAQRQNIMTDHNNGLLGGCFMLESVLLSRGGAVR